MSVGNTLSHIKDEHTDEEKADETSGTPSDDEEIPPQPPTIKIVRPFHTYGPGMKLDDGRVFADFVSDIVNNRNIIIKGINNRETVWRKASNAA